MAPLPSHGKPAPLLVLQAASLLASVCNISPEQPKQRHEILTGQKTLSMHKIILNIKIKHVLKGKKTNLELILVLSPQTRMLKISGKRGLQVGGAVRVTNDERSNLKFSSDYYFFVTLFPLKERTWETNGKFTEPYLIIFK